MGDASSRLPRENSRMHPERVAWRGASGIDLDLALLAFLVPELSQDPQDVAPRRERLPRLLLEGVHGPDELERLLVELVLPPAPAGRPALLGGAAILARAPVVGDGPVPLSPLRAVPAVGAGAPLST